ncbi:Lrp/AsnC family transcriptional regulator [Haloarcula sp. JP-L23]|uniref:Lrp/AsnC family transcriptional regulator n=1 Tax=Haloarcula sp. JP-L23 TaxID=2716717 RepID=UPI00140F079D|nr:Lrp/AsnC family transcriptional regulator [Haloarcula sp. JP-L23]
MDETDIRILSAVSDIGTGSPESIHDETGIPKSTVHYRLNKLKEQNVIEDELYSVDLSAVGLKITLITEVSAQYQEGFHTAVGEKLSALEGVNKVYFMMGDIDFIVISKLADRDMVEDLVTRLETIDEVHRTSSQFVITTVKDTTNPLTAYPEDSLTALCSDS